ncbi:phage protein [Enterococcus pernyi]
MPVENHALLGASSAHRWLVCPPLARLEENIKDRGSSFAEEGTAAHELAELQLMKRFKLLATRAVNSRLKLFKETNGYYDQSMEDYVSLYCDLVEERVNQYENAVVELEQRVDFTKWVPEGFGTSDVVILSDQAIEIIDLKYGKGVPVDAYLNPQLMLYALGAVDKYDIIYEFETVRMTIIQPRLDYISTFEIEKEELMYWADNYVAPRAVQAWEGIGEWKITDDVVKFSKVRAQLRPRAERNFQVVDKYELKEAPLLTNEEIAEILDRAPEIKKWLEHVESYALQKARDEGENFPGWKVVAGRSNRKVSDVEGLLMILEAEGFEDEDILKPQELKAIGQLEKVVGKKKFAELAKEFIIKPEGKPVLVAETDKRSALNSIDTAISDFEGIG